MTSKLITIKQAIQLGVVSIQTEDDALRESEILLQHALNVSRAYLYAHDDMTVTTPQLERYQHYIKQRSEGRPVAYIIGKRDFWTLTLNVTADTLIPRPETELLIEVALDLLDDHMPLSLLDLGTGSGAIALALASERRHWHITAVDQQMAALNVAKHSANALGLNQVDFICSDWFQKLDKQLFHAIVSNPPYLAADDPHLHEGDLRFEPSTALVSGDNGLEALHFIIRHSYNHLHQHGLLLVEHGYEQSFSVSTLLKQYGYVDIRSWKDWQGHDRVSGGRRLE